jgi:hypothetical protein
MTHQFSTYYHIEHKKTGTPDTAGRSADFGVVVVVGGSLQEEVVAAAAGSFSSDWAA